MDLDRLDNSLLIKLLAAEIVSAHGLTSSAQPAQAMMALASDATLLDTLYADIERAAALSLSADSAKQAVLGYPATTAIPGRTGSTEALERVDMDNGEVLWAAAIKVNGISAPVGFAAFVDGRRAQTQVLTPHAQPIAA